MNFQFYNELIKQPDVEEVIQELLPSLKTLENLNEKLKQLPKDDLKTASFAEVSNKVERLINKHFPNLVHDYCKLSLEYRNTAIIKRETAKDGINEYTAKDILLKNLSKLIEEIHVADHEFNDNYSHKLLVQNRIVNDLGVQKNLLEIETENVKPVELKNKFDYKNFIKNNPLPNIEKQNPTQVLKPVIPSAEKKQKKPSVFSKIISNIVPVGIIVLFLGSFGGTFYMMYSGTQNHIDVMNTAKTMMELNNDIRNIYYDSTEQINYKDLNLEKLREYKFVSDLSIVDGKYANKFEGQYIIKPYTLENKNDSYSVETTNLSEKTCIKLAKEISPAFIRLTINDKIIRESPTAVDLNSIITACSLDQNKVGYINN